LFAADEEVGDGFGAQWLCETHPDAVRCDYLINEGSGERLELGGRPFYTCSVAEKMSAPFRLPVRGRSGAFLASSSSACAIQPAVLATAKIASPAPGIMPATLVRVASAKSMVGSGRARRLVSASTA